SLAPRIAAATARARRGLTATSRPVSAFKRLSSLSARNRLAAASMAHKISSTATLAAISPDGRVTTRRITQPRARSSAIPSTLATLRTLRAPEGKREHRAILDRTLRERDEVLGDGAGRDDRITPFIEPDHLWQQFRAETATVALDAIDSEGEFLRH